MRYVTRDGTALRLDAYLPSGPGPHPAVLVIPGGRWVQADRTQDSWLPTDLAELGIAAFPVDYRSADQAAFPAALEDLQAAVRFLRDEANRFGIDPSRIGAVGASAGGHLAALLATVGEGSTSSGARILTAVSWSGPMDLERFLKGARTDVAGVIKRFLGCASSESCAQQAREASPIHHVDPSDGPIYLGNSTEEIIPLEQARLMEQALSRAGVTTQLFETPGRLHGLGAVHNEKGFSPAAAFLGESLGVDIDASTFGSGAPPDRSDGSRPDGASGTDRDRRPGVDARSDRDPTWLVVLLVAAIGIAASSLVVMIALFRRLREVTGGASSPTLPEGKDQSPSEPRLVGSRPEPQA